MFAYNKLLNKLEKCKYIYFLLLLKTPRRKYTREYMPVAKYRNLLSCEYIIIIFLRSSGAVILYDACLLRVPPPPSGVELSSAKE